VKIQNQPQVAQLSDLKSDTASVKDTADSIVDTVSVQSQLAPSLKKRKVINTIATIPSHIFGENVRPTSVHSQAT
jgi:hypothetical protein